MTQRRTIPAPGGLPQSEEWDDSEYTGEGVYVPPDQAYPTPLVQQHEAESAVREEQFEHQTEAYEELFGVTQRGETG
jgi:hypothetical protein